MNNSNRPMIDLPVWEWLRWPPAVSSAATVATYADRPSFQHDSNGRFLYWLQGTTVFYRYDTWSDTWQLLAPPPISTVAGTNFACMTFLQSYGYEGRVLAAGASTMTIPALHGQVLKGYDVRIISGTGAGQQKTIMSVGDPVVADYGTATGMTNTLGAVTITDSTKNWTHNQWVGYQVRVIYGSGVHQVRTILHNTATVLTLGDSTKQSENNNSMPAIFSPAISFAASAQTIFQIESSVVALDSNWATQPDATSRFRVLSGQVMLVSGNSTAGICHVVQVYDIVSDLWYVRSSTGGVIGTLPTDLGIDTTDEVSSIWVKSASTAAGTTTTLIDTTQDWAVDEWAGKEVFIYSGTGQGSVALISSNTADTLTFSTIAGAPDATSRYMILGFDAGTATSGAASTLTDTSKAWDVNRWANYAVKIIWGTGMGQDNIIASNTATVMTTVRPWTVAPDATSVYQICGDSDRVYLTVPTIPGVSVYGIENDMLAPAPAVDSGVARNGSVQYAGFKPIAIASLAHAANVATVTTTKPHGLSVGWSVVVRGTTALDGTYTIATVPSATTFTYAWVGSPATTLVASQSTTTLVDASKAWVTNQWAGHICYYTTADIAAASENAAGVALQIASNTGTVLTFTGIGTAPTTGISKYTIIPRKLIGQLDDGIATGTQSTTTLQDTTKVGTFTATTVNGSNSINVTGVTSGVLYVGHAVSGAGIPTGAIITAFGTGTGGTGTYTISMPATASAAGVTVTSGWVVNGYAGRYLRITSATGIAQQLLITFNTNNTLTFGAGTAPVTLMSSYSIHALPLPGVGHSGSSTWNAGVTDVSKAGRYLYFARAGATSDFFRIDLVTNKAEVVSTFPQTETLTTGSQYAYDGKDTLYFQKDATQRIFSLNLNTLKVTCVGQYPYAAGTAILGNRMEVITSPDGIKFLVINRPSNQEVFRLLLN